MGVEVVSVHFPKSGGTSLIRTLTAAYGSDAVHLDYADDPANPCSQWSLDPQGSRLKVQGTSFSPAVRVVHGHFHPAKYDFLGGARRITFIRHPVDCLISIYFFWKARNTGHCVSNYFREQRMSVLELARVPAIRYLLSRTYFGSVDVERFDFIGFMESYGEDVRRLSRLLSVSMVEVKENLNNHPRYDEEVAAIRSDRRLVAALQDQLIEDIRLYDRLKQRHAAASAV